LAERRQTIDVPSDEDAQKRAAAQFGLMLATPRTDNPNGSVKDADTP
jgi:hypothetical protein